MNIHLGQIESIEDSKQRSTGLILTTNKDVKVFEWIPKDRFKDIHRNPTGDSDDDIKRKWNTTTVDIDDTTLLLTKDNIRIDSIPYKGTLISIDGQPKFFFFGNASKSLVKIKKNEVLIGYTSNRTKYSFSVDVNKSEYERIGML